MIESTNTTGSLNSKFLRISLRRSDILLSDRFFWGHRRDGSSCALRNLPKCLEVSETCRIFAVGYKHIDDMEAKTTNISTGRRISRTARVARANKWVIELVSPELQAQCKSYKDGKKIINP